MIPLGYYLDWLQVEPDPILAGYPSCLRVNKYSPYPIPAGYPSKLRVSPSRLRASKYSPHPNSKFDLAQLRNSGRVSRQIFAWSN